MNLTSNKILQLYKQAKIINSVKELRSVVKNRDVRFPLSFDTETTSATFNNFSYLYCKNIPNNVCLPYNYPYIIGISMAVMVERKIHLLWARRPSSLFNAACKVLSKKSSKTAHNARYDIRAMNENGFDVAPEVECTYTMARIYWDRRQKHSLKALAEILCAELSGWEEPIKTELRKLRTAYTRKGFPKDYVNYSFIPDEIMAKYSSLDSFWAMILWIYLEEKAKW